MDKLIDKFFSWNIRALAKILTAVEARETGFEKILAKLAKSKGKPFCLGITGPPGAGKSTIVDKLIHILRKNGKKVGVVAIDPSSPFSGGAVLGDRIRMQDHASDEGVFIRSLGSRGSHGGLSRATRDIVHVMKAFSFDYIIVETVGVGQTELDIMELADTTVVVLVPEAGDTVQTMKAGLLEIADIFTVNKSDRPAAGQIVGGLTALVELDKKSKWNIPVIKTEAINNKGIDELFKTITEHAKFCESDSSRINKNKELKRAELIQIAAELFERDLKEKLVTDKKLAALLKKVEEGKVDPYSAAEKLVKS